VTIKLATQAPVNSTWHKALLDMGAQWNTGTSGRVKLTVYAGGTQGDEPSTIRMMRPGVDQLQANLLMVAGLAQVDDAFNVFGMPFFFQSDEEALAVQQKLTPVLQIFRDAKYMLDIRVAPLVGGLVITNAAWNKIDAADQKVVMDAAHAFEQRIMTDAPKQDRESVATMKTRGLVVTTLDAKAAADFRAAAEKLVPTLRGTIVPGDIYDRALQERDAFRKSKGQ
jgi:TRAP-type C4-dicarboxylate transport system substrate-binding protein